MYEKMCAYIFNTSKIHTNNITMGKRYMVLLISFVIVLFTSAIIVIEDECVLGSLSLAIRFKYGFKILTECLTLLETCWMSHMDCNPVS